MSERRDEADEASAPVTLAHPRSGGGLALPPPPPPPPPLSVARVNRLLRPLRSALASLSTELTRQHALDHAQPRPAPLTRPRPRPVDPDWDSPSAKRPHRRRSSIAIGPQHQSRHLSLAATAANPNPDSSPFKRRRPPRPAATYGSRRGHPPPPASRTAPPPRPPLVDQPSPRRDVRLTPADLRARLAQPDAGLASPVVQQRAATALRAYATVLEAISSPCAAHERARGPPSLAEVAARTLGSGIEDDLRALGAHLVGAAASDGGDDQGAGTSVAMDRSASAQDVELGASTAQDEWYESSTPHAVRWMLGDHATAIVIDALETVDAPFGLWECCFDLCLAHAAHAEASRFHAPLLAALLSTPRSPPPPSIFPLLRRTPSPSAFLHSALVSTLLSSSFSQRLFYHPSLSLTSTTISSSPRDATLLGTLFAAHCAVAAAMLRSIRTLTASTGSPELDPVDPDSARNLQDEVRRKVAAQARAALVCALKACARPRAAGTAGDGGAEALEDVRGALAVVLSASSDAAEGRDNDSLERDELAGSPDGDGESSAADELRALEAVCALALALRDPAARGAPSSLSSAIASLGDGVDDLDALGDALQRFFPLVLAVVGPSPQPVDARLLDRADASTPGGAALLRALSGCRAASEAARAEAGLRLASGREEDDDSAQESELHEPPRGVSGGAHLSRDDEYDDEAADYDEPVVVVSPLRSRARQARRHCQIVRSPEPDTDDNLSSRPLTTEASTLAVTILWASFHHAAQLEREPAYSGDDGLLDRAGPPGSLALAPDPAEKVVVVYNSTSRHSPFRPRRPCNILTTSLVALSPDSPPQRFLSPSPPLAPSAPLSARLDDWLSSPLVPPELWTQYSKQTCGNPSVRRSANRLHVRDSAATWAQMDVERVRGIREELAGVLRQAEEEGRLSEWASEGKKGTRGIVWTAGNADTFDRVLTSLRLLRLSFNCSLPAHVFHFPTESPSTEQAAAFSALNTTFAPLDSISKDEEGGRAKSFHLKGAALVQAPFDEVLLLDSGNIPVRDVAPLFDSPEYLEMGVVLWPDFFKDQPENSIWSILGVQCRDEWSTESGQVLVRKSQHLDVLLLVEYMLVDWRFWFHFSDGDKDVFRYAFLALRKRWAVPARHLSSASWIDPNALGGQNRNRFAGHSMMQYGMASELDGGRVLFVHANLLKRVLGKLHDGNTWGRTLRLRVPPLPPPLSNSSSSNRRSPPFLLSADHLANVSPLTGLGIPSPSTRSSPSPIPRSARARALLERGLSMRFWSGHISRGAYVLAVESEWEDELGSGASWGEENEKQDGEAREGEDVEARYREGEEEQELWAQWLERERAAQCGGESEDGVHVLHDVLLGADEAGAGAGGAGMEVVSWVDDPDLREFEARYYGVGRGKAGGAGFR
ncbi:hypothetical protein JCM9279_007068 [Rhodotorula babjevae]